MGDLWVIHMPNNGALCSSDVLVGNTLVVLVHDISITISVLLDAVLRLRIHELLVETTPTIRSLKLY